MERKVRSLLSELSLEEKVAQLVSLPVEALVEDGSFSRAKALEVLKYGIGEITRVSGSRLGLKPREAAKLVNDIQRFLVEETPHRIPAIVHEESLAGLMASTATCFPQAIGLASTWDPELVFRVADEIRRQARLVGAHQCLAPVLDVCRDPRWGRTEETYGEDPYLVAAMGCAYVSGLQSGDLRRGVVATLKHFAAHGFPEGGRNTARVQVGMRELREVFLYPFEAAVKEAGALSVMPAYHEIDGVPCHANRWLLTDLLRGEWGFKGIVVSDYFAVRQLESVHRVAERDLDAAIQALEAGVDVELPHPDCYLRLVDAAREGLISAKPVDEAVERVLTLKFLLGLFENPYVNEEGVPETLDNDKARGLAREAARKSIVLLKNDGILPLKGVKRIAIIGPNAASGIALLGDYHYAAHVGLPEPAVKVVSVLEEVKSLAPPGTEVLYAEGCGVRSHRTDGFEAALKVSQNADVVIAVMGERAGGFWLSNPELSSGEGVDRASLGLPGVQEELLRRVLSLGKPTVLILVNGRPISLPPDILEGVRALIEAWYPGEEGGLALAEVIFGVCSPGGRLPISVPKSVGQIPVYYYRRGASFNPYVELDSKPLFPFGFGLSYTEFRYSDLRIEPEVVEGEDAVEVSVTVENVGEVKGDEVVQLYVARKSSSVTRPARELKGFKRVTVEPGERVRVAFKLPIELLAFYNRGMKLVVEPGEYRVIVARHAEDTTLEGSLKVVGKTREVVSRRRFLSQADATRLG